MLSTKPFIVSLDTCGSAGECEYGVWGRWITEGDIRRDRTTFRGWPSKPGIVERVGGHLGFPRCDGPPFATLTTRGPHRPADVTARVRHTSQRPAPVRFRAPAARPAARRRGSSRSSAE